MERARLKQARIERGLSRQELAIEIGWSQVAIGRWERGEADPQVGATVALCAFFDKNPVDLDLVSELSEEELKMIEKILENKIVARREALERLLSLPAFAAIDWSALLKPLVSPDAFLNSCNSTINGCWQLMKGSEFAVVGDIIAAHIPVLSNLARHPSEFQEDAALLAVRAKIMQILLATYREDFVGRNLLCREAVEFAELAGNSLALTAALYWQADTFVYCYHQPGKAIPVLKNGLAHVDTNALQNKSALCSNLAIAYAQNGKETLAQSYMDQAGAAMIMIPAGLFQCNLNTSSLYRDEGKMFLALAQHFPQKNYAQRAYDAFSQSLENGPVKNTSLSQIFIHKADAARCIGDLDEFTRCLTEGTNIAHKIGSQKHQRDAIAVRDRASVVWKGERKYQELIF